MELSEESQEALERLWIGLEEEKKVSMKENMVGSISVIWELKGRKMIEEKNGSLALTRKGKRAAANVIRRHRLAERLFHDLLEMDEDTLESPACKFEHILISGEVEEGICTLLGHPEECPHGRLIPPGPCCKEQRKETSSVIHTLNSLKEGQRANVIYIKTDDHSKLQKLMAMGVLPGRTITMIQRYPSYVFSIGGSQVAVDSDIASGIQVRLEEE